MTIRRNVGQVTKGAVAVGQRSAGRIIGKTCEHVPTGAVLVVQTESRSEIVDAGFALVGAIAIFTQQEKPWPTTSFVSARRFLRCAASFICLRKASNIASLIACGGVTETTL